MLKMPFPYNLRSEISFANITLKRYSEDLELFEQRPFSNTL